MSDGLSRYAWEGFQLISQGITIFDENLHLVFWNDRFLDLLEFPKHLAFEGATFESFIRFNAENGEYGPGDCDELVKERVALARKFEKHSLERTRPNGTIVKVVGSPLPTGGFVTVYTDVTDRRKREAKLEMTAAEHARDLVKSEQRLELIANEVPAGIAHVDEDLTIIFANKRFARAYELTPEEIVGRNCHDVLHPETMRESKKFFEPVRAGKVVDFEMKVQMPKGIKYVRTFLRPDSAEPGKMASFYVVSVDVTRNKAATTALLSSQKMDALGRLSSGISHDFNNLLTIILGNLVPLENEVRDDRLREEFIVPAISAARRGSSLTERLINLARKKPINAQPVEADESIDGLIQLLRSSIPENIDINLELEANNERILVDVSEYETALLNLIVNARDAIDGPGSITISSSIQTLEDDEAAVLRLPSGEYLKIKVADTGGGMTPLETEQVFEPFHTTKGDVGGSGLGLAMVYTFIRQSNGAIWVDSEKGAGSTFTFILPVTKEIANPQQPSQSTVHWIDPHKKPTVLLVEDDKEVRRVVRRQLNDIGYAAIEAEDAAGALELLDIVHDLTAVLSDVIMPGEMDGTELARHVKEMKPDVSIVLMSGNLDEADHLKNAPKETPLLRKPFSNNELSVALSGIGQRSFVKVKK